MILISHKVQPMPCFDLLTIKMPVFVVIFIIFSFSMIGVM